MTESVKNIILRHKDVLLSREVQQRHGLIERDIISAATLPELDEAYTRKVSERFPPGTNLFESTASNRLRSDTH